jgi:hypothetical protein
MSPVSPVLTSCGGRSIVFSGTAQADNATIDAAAAQSANLRAGCLLTDFCLSRVSGDWKVTLRHIDGGVTVLRSTDAEGSGPDEAVFETVESALSALFDIGFTSIRKASVAGARTPRSPKESTLKCERFSLWVLELFAGKKDLRVGAANCSLATGARRLFVTAATTPGILDNGASQRKSVRYLYNKERGAIWTRKN